MEHPEQHLKVILGGKHEATPEATTFDPTLVYSEMLSNLKKENYDQVFDRLYKLVNGNSKELFSDEFFVKLNNFKVAVDERNRRLSEGVIMPELNFDLPSIRELIDQCIKIVSDNKKA